MPGNAGAHRRAPDTHARLVVSVDRAAAGLLLALGLLTTFVVGIGRSGTAAAALALVLGAGFLAAGGSVLAGSPSPARTQRVAVASTVLIAGTGLLGPLSTVYAVALIAVSCWVGLVTGPGAALRLAPFTLTAALLPGGLGVAPLELGPALAQCLLGVGLGELLGWLLGEVASAAAQDAARLAAVRRLVHGAEGLLREDEPRSAATATARLAVDLTGARGAWVQGANGRSLGCWPHQRRRHTPTADCLQVALPGADGRTVGVLAVSDGQRDAFTADLLDALAIQAGLSLHRLAETAGWRSRAETDALTGLGNRRYLDAALRRLRPGDLVVLLDLDHFKAVNDTYGHAAGDAVLRDFGRVLGAALREGDVAARAGGEEFVLVLRGASGARPDALLERLGQRWAAAAPLTTFSAGAATHRDGRSAEQTLGSADAALYTAKRSGRARAVLAAGPGGPSSVVAFPSGSGRSRERPAPGEPAGRPLPSTRRPPLLTASSGRHRSA